MAGSAGVEDIYLEIGKKKVIAAAVHWPGWCRIGKDEVTAVENLLQVGPRYSALLGELGPVHADGVGSLHIVAWLEGNATTDYGVPVAQLDKDWALLETAELARTAAVLEACWKAFDQAIEAAAGRDLQKGPRGGGRDLAQIVEHVVGAEQGYLRSLGWKVDPEDGESIYHYKDRIRGEVLNGMEAANDGQLPRVGPRGGKRWPPRYFARRLAWHIVDHTWEIEDRII